MFDQPQEPIFFHEAHRAFLENRDADVLDWKVMRLNLYQLKTGEAFGRYWHSWPAIIIQGAGGISFGGMGILFLYAFGREGVEYLIQHGVPHWRPFVSGLIMYGWFIVLMGFSTLIGRAMLKEALNLLLWPDRRIAILLRKVVEDGQLIKGEIMAGKYTNSLNWEVTYRFPAPTGKILQSAFLPGSRQDHEPGTPVWVLYLNDKINVLL